MSSQANGRIRREKENRRISLSDAAVTAAWLNAAKQVKPHASYNRVLHIHQQLGELRDARLGLRDFGPGPEKWDAAVRELEKKRKLLKAGKISHFEAHFPSDCNRDTPEGERLYLELSRKADDLARALNKQLHRYIFRPQVAYARLPGSISVLQNVWAGGMAPDRRTGLETTVNGWPVSEADAALALVRLDLSGDLAKIVLCEMCHERWLVVWKKSYRFCSKKCREESYTQLPDYHERKARTQRERRRNENLRNAREDAAWKRGR